MISGLDGGFLFLEVVRLKCAWLDGIKVVAEPEVLGGGGH